MIEIIVPLICIYAGGFIISAHLLENPFYCFIWPLVLLKEIVVRLLECIQAVVTLDKNYRILGLSTRKIVISLAIITAATVIPYYIGKLIGTFVIIVATNATGLIVLTWFVGWFFPLVFSIIAIFIGAVIREYILWLKK